MRTHRCGDLSIHHIGQRVRLCGWIHTTRHLGGMLFLVLRDASGAVQAVVSDCSSDRTDSGSNDRLDERKETTPAAPAPAGHETSNNRSNNCMKVLSSLPLESVIMLIGTIVERKRLSPGSTVRGNGSNAVELQVSCAHVLNRVRGLGSDQAQLPMAVNNGVADADAADEEGNNDTTSENVRLRWRFLDIRRPYMQSMLRLRADMASAVRTRLEAMQFLHVETPHLVRSTPEGAAEFLVPSREANRFYALPQSPQQHKQILMSAGVDKYYQLARCYRDEGLRSDRQPEFTQLDLEMAFARDVDVMHVCEEVWITLLMHVLWKGGEGEENRKQQPREEETSDAHVCQRDALVSAGILADTVIPRMSYTDAMNDYGSDKPDTRYKLKLVDVYSCLSKTDTQPGHCIKAFCAPRLGEILSRKELALFQERHALKRHGVYMVRVKKQGNFALPREFRGIGDEDNVALRSALDASYGDVIFLMAGEWRTVCPRLGTLRVACARILADRGALSVSAPLIHALWITDFPLLDFERADAKNSDFGVQDAVNAEMQLFKVRAMHHPFTAVHGGDEKEDVLMHVCRVVLGRNARNGVGGRQKLDDGGEPVTQLHLLPQEYEALSELRGQHYDFVVNGQEIGGGSVRIHREEAQRVVLELLSGGGWRTNAKEKTLALENDTFERSDSNFAHLLEALRFGCPPHAGIALGFDRLVATLAGLVGVRERLLAIRMQGTASENILWEPVPLRDVIAFPKSKVGRDLLTNAPSTVTREVLQRYHLPMEE